MKKIFLIILLGGLLFPLIASAGTYIGCEDIDEEGNCIGPHDIYYEGLIPCGKEVYKDPVFDADGNFINGEAIEPRCTFCHFFVMLDGIIDFFLLPPPAGGGIVLFIAILMLVIGGVMFMFAHFGGAEMLPGGGAGGPKMLGQAKKLITSVVIGLIIIFAAWIIIDLFFSLIGVAEWTGLQEGWFRIKCSIQLPD